MRLQSRAAVRLGSSSQKSYTFCSKLLYRAVIGSNASCSFFVLAQLSLHTLQHTIVDASLQEFALVRQEPLRG